MVSRSGAIQGNEEGASEVIGELMMLAITVMIFIILLATITAMISRPRTEIVHMSGQVLNGTAIEITHMGGDSIPYSRLSASINGKTEQLYVSDTSGNGQWDLGEVLTIYGLDTSQSLSVMIYDNSTNQMLGNFDLG